MWKGAFGLEDPEDVPIDAITNGIHVRTWLAPEADAFWRREIGLRPARATPHSTQWSRALDADPNSFWDLRNDLRANLVRFLRHRLGHQADQERRRPGRASRDLDLLRSRRTDDRFRTPIRDLQASPLIFRDLERLEGIIDDIDQPVQIIFAGKAHPRTRVGRPSPRRSTECRAGNGFEDASRSSRSTTWRSDGC